MRDGKRQLEVMRWGIIPFFHKGTKKDWKVATFNARADPTLIDDVSIAA